MPGIKRTTHAYTGGLIAEYPHNLTCPPELTDGQTGYWEADGYHILDENDLTETLYTFHDGRNQ